MTINSNKIEHQGYLSEYLFRKRQEIQIMNDNKL